jgi:hypothetical protein
MTSTKNPEQEAQHPAPMPRNQQGQGGSPKDRDPAGQQGGTHGGEHEHKAKMAVHSDSPPGIELDGKAHVIPVEQRTKADREKAKKAR